MNIDTSKPSYVILYTAIVSAAFTAAIMVLNVVAKPAIEQNRRVLKRRALAEILFHNPQQEGLSQRPDEMSDEQVLEVYDKRIYTSQLPVADGGDPIELITAYSVDVPPQGPLPGPDKIVGYAIEVNGVGFWEPISGYLAMGPGLEYSRGLVILRQAETPGLGGKITEEEFRNQWAPGQKLQVDPNPQGKHVYITKTDPNDIPPESPEAGRHVDAITGATQTSIALMKFINDDLRRFHQAAQAYGLVQKGPPGPDGNEATNSRTQAQ